MGERPNDDCESAPPLRPRIYLASLADYNAGRLHGVWLDATQSLEELEGGVQRMLASSGEAGAEEFAIHDYDDFAGIRLDEYTSLSIVASLANHLARYGRAFAALVEWLGIEAATEEAFQNHYRRSWENAQVYAEDLLTELGIDGYLDEVPDSLRPYVTVDVAGFARDLELGGDIYVAEDRTCVHVFDAHA